MSGDDDQLPTFSARLRWAREQRGLKGTELASLIKRTEKSVYRYEGTKQKQKQMPSRSTLKRLAKALGVSAVWLEYGRGQPYGLQEVEGYLQSDKAADIASDVADALREMPWAKMGMAKPRPEQVNRVRILLELVMPSTPQPSDADKGG